MSMARDLLDILQQIPGLVHDVTETGCSAQNGRTDGRVSVKGDPKWSGGKYDSVYFEFVSC